MDYPHVQADNPWYNYYVFDRRGFTSHSADAQPEINFCSILDLEIFDARRLIEVDVCEGKEVTKISLVPLDSCAYTSEELIIPSAKYT